MLIRLLSILMFYFLTQNVYSFTHTIKGNNIIWSPVSDLKFIYSVYGKSSGKKIWKEYDLKNRKEKTVYYGDSLVPQWSYDGKSVLFTKGNVLMINSKGTMVKEFKASVAEPTSLDWSLKGDKITYSDGEKIYMLELKNNNNYLVINGESPLFVDNDKKILYLDKDMKVNIVDKSLKSRVLLDKIVKKIFPLKNRNKFLFHTGNAIKLYDISDDIIYTLVLDEKKITGFNVSYDFNFLTYNNDIGEHFIVHIPTMLKVPVVKDEMFFTQKLSANIKYYALENSREIHIKDVENYISAFKLEDIYKASFGSADGIKVEASLEVYQEKKNPFTGKLTGYEAQNFKGSIRVIAVYKDYCFGMADKKSSDKNRIETGDVVIWKEKNKMGIIIKK